MLCSTLLSMICVKDASRGWAGEDMVVCGSMMDFGWWFLALVLL